jgi:hypothetical protein
MLHFYGEDPSATPFPSNIQPQDHLWLLTPSAFSQLPSVVHVDAVSAIRNLMAARIAVTRDSVSVDWLIVEKFLFSYSFTGTNLIRNFWCSLLDADF